MRRTLGFLMLMLALAGCGDDSGDGGDTGRAGHAGERSSSSSATSTAHVTLVSATAGGGDEADTATRLPDDAAITSYVAQFSDAFAGEVREAATAVDVADGEVLVAQVVTVGCDTPPDAQVRTDGSDVVIVPERPASPMKECFAPVTTVGLAAVAD